MNQYKPNPRIVVRAAELWVQMLSNPKYDNLGKNSNEPPDSLLANTVASVLASKLPKNNTTEVLAHFGEELKTLLSGPIEWESEFGGKREKHTTLFRDLGVDYHPDIPLQKAAERSGLKIEFPWKTHMWLNEDSLSLRYGYGAVAVYHYPISGNRWLVTTLNGSDIEKIIALVESGVLTTDLKPL